MPLLINEPFVEITKETAPRIAGQPCIRLGTPVPGYGTEPDGVWARWHWDGAALTVQNDRLGFYPLYYSVQNAALLVSPSIPQLLARGVSRTLDDEGLSTFLRLGYFIGDHTPFREIKALPPNANLRWEDGNIDLRHALPTPTALDTSRAEAMQRYAELFQAAIQRRLPEGRCAVPLSGGRDSRHIALELHRQGVKPHCVTATELLQDTEPQIAAQLADELGLPIKILQVSRAKLAAEREKNERTNYCADEHGWYLPVAEYLAEHFDTAYDGIGGDVLSAGLFLDRQKLTLMRAGKFHQLAVHIACYSEQALFNLLSPTLRARFPRQLAIESIARELSRYADWPNPVGAFYLFNRTRREIALSPYRLIDRRLKVHAPYLDRDLFDFLASLPAEHFLDKQFHTDTIMQSYPRFASIPYSCGNSLPTGYRLHEADAALLASMLWRAESKKVINRSFLLLRAIRSAIDTSYYEEFILGCAARATYLTQLAEVADIEPLDTLSRQRANQRYSGTGTALLQQPVSD